MSRLSREEILKLKASPAVYLPLAESVTAGDWGELQEIRVVFLSSFTAELLRPFLIVEGASFGMKIDLSFGPFNQFEQQIFEPGSGIYNPRPDAVILALRLEEASPALISGFLDEPSIEREIVGLKDRLVRMLEGIRANSTAPVLVWNFSEPQFIGAGVADASLPIPMSDAVNRANMMLARLMKQYPGLYVFDAHRLSMERGSSQWHDQKLFFLARIPFAVEAQRHIGRRLARYLNSLTCSPRKCLVLDLDNTLWGGIVGEDGVGGIALGEDYPGSAYKGFQRYVLSLKHRGVLLAISSKNNPDDAMEALRTHPDCLLRPSDFVAIHIGWDDKPNSLAAIARELNIGSDTLVFFDDNPVERSLVRECAPEVLVVDVPTSPLGYIEAIEESGAFDYLVLSDEDRRRTESYLNQHERKFLQHNSASTGEFLRALGMRATIGLVGEETLLRSVQLLAKTNQYNVTTRRHDASEILRMIQGGGIALWLRLADRFGDNGITGLAIAVPEQNGIWIIDSLLLSCRIIGRQAERLLLGRLSRLVRERGASELRGEFVPTARNSPAAGLFAECEFEPMDNEGRWWLWDYKSGYVSEPDFFEIEFIGG